ncbi:MAG: cyclase family protein [Thermoguttaceae bacterium]|nr:cyclase family protein [Thermoguttaceae bacterium]
MKFLDLTREISESSPVYPGDPPVLLTSEAEWERDGIRLRNLSFSSHQGTHIDAPAHVLESGAFLNAFPLEVFSGPARVLKLGKVRPRTALTREMLETFEEIFRECPRILFSASWEGRQFEDAPFFTPEAALWLTRQEHILLLGFDWASPDAFEDEDLPIHRILLAERLLFIENLTNLEKLPDEFRLTAFPISFDQADGAPVRAVAEFE